MIRKLSFSIILNDPSEYEGGDLKIWYGKMDSEGKPALKIDNLNLPQTLLVSSNLNTRILWMGPDNWLVVSKNKEIEKSILENLSHDDFALTDLSHSRTILELEGS